MEVWGASDCAVVRALTPHQCGPGSNPGIDAICGLSLLLVLSFALRGFFGYSSFPLSSKTNIPNFNSIRNQVDEERLCGCAISFSHYVKFYCFMFRHKISTRVVCLYGKHTGSCTHIQCPGTPPFRGHKIWLWKNTLIIFIIFVCITSIEGTPLFRGKGPFFSL